MDNLTSDKLKALIEMEEEEFHIDQLRKKYSIDPESSVFYMTISRMIEGKVLKRLRRGYYRKIKKVLPVNVFGKEYKNDIFDIHFPRDYDSHLPFPFSEDVVIRCGDLILIAGVSNYGKTALAMNFLAENIEYSPVLMGNEYTTQDGMPTPRFINRLNAINWVDWVNGDGGDRFQLLPVTADYAEYVVKDKMNIVDWINIETGEHYMINSIMNEIKRAVGDGVGVLVIQKAEGVESGRGGQFTKDYADLELLIDPHGESESRLTIGKCKESTKRVTGRSWAFGIGSGVRLIDIREVVKCPNCHGRGYTKTGQCPDCWGKKYIDK